MGMSTCVEGFRDDKDHDRHVRVWEMCQKEGVSLPKETAAYLGGADPAALSEEEIEGLLRVDLRDCLRNLAKDDVAGYELTVDELPKSVTRIRFYNSW